MSTGGDGDASEGGADSTDQRDGSNAGKVHVGTNYQLPTVVWAGIFLLLVIHTVS